MEPVKFCFNTEYATQQSWILYAKYLYIADRQNPISNLNKLAKWTAFWLKIKTAFYFLLGW